MSTRGGRTVWWAKDSGWWRREYIVELGEEFGPAGPAVIDWLACEAKVQNDGGFVKTGYRSLARGCFIDLDTARRVVSRAVTLGPLDDFTGDERRFTVRISGWSAEQERGRAYARKQDERDRKAAAAAEDSGARHAVSGHAPSQGVTPGHGESLTEQDRVNDPPNPPQAGGTLLPGLLDDMAPKAPTGNGKRQARAYEQAIETWTAKHFPGVRPAAIRGALSTMRSYGKSAITADALRAFIATPAGEPYRHYFDEPTEAAA